jgi:hypothetical protein
VCETCVRFFFITECYLFCVLVVNDTDLSSAAATQTTTKVTRKIIYLAESPRDRTGRKHWPRHLYQAPSIRFRTGKSKANDVTNTVHGFCSPLPERVSRLIAVSRNGLRYVARRQGSAQKCPEDHRRRQTDGPVWGKLYVRLSTNRLLPRRLVVDWLS